MRSHRLSRRFRLGLAALAVAAIAGPVYRPIQAAPPVVTLGPTGAKILVTAASLSEAIDALSRAGGFKVTYEGPRPGVMLYNAEIDTPSVAETLFRLVDGQNLNYAVKFDLTGRRVTSLIVLGTPPRAGGASGGPAGARPQAFTPPRGARVDAVEDDLVEPEPEPAPSPSPSPPISPTGGPGRLTQPSQSSPFGPRPIGSPFGPRPSPSP